MSEADHHSFEYNKRHGLIWRDSEDGNYHPVVTIVECAVCGYEDNADNMICVGDFLVCGKECKEEFEGEKNASS